MQNGGQGVVVIPLNRHLFLSWNEGLAKVSSLIKIQGQKIMNVSVFQMFMISAAIHGDKDIKMGHSTFRTI